MSDSLHPGSHIHLIAICGVGMASLAGLLQAQGYQVTGSDQNVYPPMSTYLAEIGIPVQTGFRADNLSRMPDLVVVGNAVSRDNPEVQAVMACDIPFISFPDALGRFLIGDKTSLVIAGTHGKTTTTALAAWVLSRAGSDPSFFIGGVPLNFGSGWRAGSGPHVVLEGDEYDTAFFDKGPKFLHYRPSFVVLTSLEFDHADIYRDLDHLTGAFRRLMEIVPAHGGLVVCGDYPSALEVASAVQSRRVTYGDSEDCDWSLGRVVANEGRTVFEPCYRGVSEGRVEVGLIGRHNIKNALSVYALARLLGFEPGGLQEYFAGFGGVRRRQELRGEKRGVKVFDDFAHHPTAVRETLRAFRDAYPGRRLWAIFEPRSNTSKRNIFEREFSGALAEADRVIVANVYQAEKIAAHERLSVASVVAEINRMHGDDRAELGQNAERIASFVATHARNGDIVVVMSNGAFDGVHEKILHALAG